MVYMSTAQNSTELVPASRVIGRTPAREDSPVVSVEYLGLRTGSLLTLANGKVVAAHGSRIKVKQ